MLNKVRIVRDYPLGHLGLLPGSVLVSTDDLAPLVAIGVAVRDEEPKPPAAEPETIQSRDPKPRTKRVQ